MSGAAGCTGSAELAGAGGGAAELLALSAGGGVVSAGAGAASLEEGGGVLSAGGGGGGAASDDGAACSGFAGAESGAAPLRAVMQSSRLWKPAAIQASFSLVLF